jgi:L-alanine-DL-glutamate epimerase-like enolase superfamily enzyme
MKIARIEAIPVSYPEPNDFNALRHLCLAKITADDGQVGWGESITQFPEANFAAKAIVEGMAPNLVGKDPVQTETLWRQNKQQAWWYGYHGGIASYATAAIDIALWDLKGRAIGRPVHALLGGALRRRVPAYVTGFYYRDNERPDDLVREAALYVEQGYRTLKVKVGGLTPEGDAERVGVIRRAVGKDVALMLDANQGWSLPSALRAAQLCAEHDVFWLEDPMPWFDERQTLRRLKAATSIPIAAGETEYSPFGLRTMLAEGLVDYLIIDSTWAGGLTTWRKAAVMAELYQIPMAAHHDPQIHVHAVAASPTGFILESFADPTRDPLWFELFRERPAIVDGFMAVPDAPGLGLELREETLEKYGVRIG